MYSGNLNEDKDRICTANLTINKVSFMGLEWINILLANFGAYPLWIWLKRHQSKTNNSMKFWMFYFFILFLLVNLFFSKCDLAVNYDYSRTTIVVIKLKLKLKVFEKKVQVKHLHVLSTVYISMFRSNNIP